MEPTRRVRYRQLIAQPWVFDAAVVAACLILTAIAVKTTLAARDPWSSLPVPVVVAAGVVGSMALWSRRRRSGVACVVGAVTFVLSGNPGPWLVGLYSAAKYGQRHRVWVYGVVAWAGFIAWAWTDKDRPTLDDAVLFGVAVALIVAVGVHMATHSTLLASYRERTERMETERALRDEQARTAERTRIAHEMHDDLAHKVSLIALHAGALELHATGDPRLREGVILIRSTAREALQELRSVLGVLRADTDGVSADRVGEPFADVGSLVVASQRAGQRVDLCQDAGELPPATARVVYRIVQEGLTNTHKHAPGAATSVRIRRDAGNVTVTVRNDESVGRPVDLPASGRGLVGLAERIRLVGGALCSGPIGTGGWELYATVPWLDRSTAQRHSGSNDL